MLAGFGTTGDDRQEGQGNRLPAPRGSSTEARAAQRSSQCAYAYPASSIAWKNSRQTVQTAGVPPNQGRIKRPMMGWTWNSRKALRRSLRGREPGSRLTDFTTSRTGKIRVTTALADVHL